MSTLRCSTSSLADPSNPRSPPLIPRREGINIPKTTTPSTSTSASSSYTHHFRHQPSQQSSTNYLYGSSLPQTYTLAGSSQSQPPPVHELSSSPRRSMSPIGGAAFAMKNFLRRRRGNTSDGGQGLGLVSIASVTMDGSFASSTSSFSTPSTPAGLTPITTPTTTVPALTLLSTSTTSTLGHHPPPPPVSSPPTVQSFVIVGGYGADSGSTLYDFPFDTTLAGSSSSCSTLPSPCQSPPLSPVTAAIHGPAPTLAATTTGTSFSLKTRFSRDRTSTLNTPSSPPSALPISTVPRRSRVATTDVLMSTTVTTSTSSTLSASSTGGGAGGLLAATAASMRKKLNRRSLSVDNVIAGADRRRSGTGLKPFKVRGSSSSLFNRSESSLVTLSRPEGDDGEEGGGMIEMLSDTSAAQQWSMMDPDESFSASDISMASIDMSDFGPSSYPFTSTALAMALDQRDSSSSMLDTTGVVDPSRRKKKSSTKKKKSSKKKEVALQSSSSSLPQEPAPTCIPVPSMSLAAQAERSLLNHERRQAELDLYQNSLDYLSARHCWGSTSLAVEDDPASFSSTKAVVVTPVPSTVVTLAMSTATTTRTTCSPTQFYDAPQTRQALRMLTGTDVKFEEMMDRGFQLGSAAQADKSDRGGQEEGQRYMTLRITLTPWHARADEAALYGSRSGIGGQHGSTYLKNRVNKFFSRTSSSSSSSPGLVSTAAATAAVSSPSSRLVSPIKVPLTSNVEVENEDGCGGEVDNYKVLVVEDDYKVPVEDEIKPVPVNASTATRQGRNPSHASSRSSSREGSRASSPRKDRRGGTRTPDPSFHLASPVAIIPSASRFQPGSMGQGQGHGQDRGPFLGGGVTSPPTTPIPYPVASIHPLQQAPPPPPPPLTTFQTSQPPRKGSLTTSSLPRGAESYFTPTTSYTTTTASPPIVPPRRKGSTPALFYHASSPLLSPTHSPMTGGSGRVLPARPRSTLPFSTPGSVSMLPVMVTNTRPNTPVQGSANSSSNASLMASLPLSGPSHGQPILTTSSKRYPAALALAPSSTMYTSPSARAAAAAATASGNRIYPPRKRSDQSDIMSASLAASRRMMLTTMSHGSSAAGAGSGSVSTSHSPPLTPVSYGPFSLVAHTSSFTSNSLGNGNVYGHGYGHGGGGGADDSFTSTHSSSSIYSDTSNSGPAGLAAGGGVLGTCISEPIILDCYHFAGLDQVPPHRQQQQQQQQSRKADQKESGSNKNRGAGNQYGNGSNKLFQLTMRDNQRPGGGGGGSATTSANVSCESLTGYGGGGGGGGHKPVLHPRSAARTNTTTNMGITSRREGERGERGGVGGHGGRRKEEDEMTASKEEGGCWRPVQLHQTSAMKTFAFP